MSEAILYVKSEKVDQVQYTMPNWGHWCSAGYRSSKTDFVLNEEDRKAIEALERAGISCKVVDLGQASMIAQIRAKIEGVNSTPTLLYKGQKIKGLEQILSALEKL
ncbi:MAG: hypothetical protein OH319_03540 [Candidatus Parvarchaeota archaeon]|nr:hypothetical protein [Candidatus Jingweiarchaeum tengchongense]MCW1298555.1 hypothetical protein [Candidatus Jingweiarchaeum tengchongense]MCW1304578.1 hypothetical protein [Candidatus Jingweiarchaeum tengchongense]MCW1310250.1 hypothetical protein [Candidatus Jingweiarchaeum tengchongense]